MNPAGAALVSVAEERSSGSVVGAYAVFPFRLLIEGESVMVGQRGDLIVEKRCRGQGIFKALRPHAESQSREAGMAFTFSMPNPAAWAGHRRMGCIEVGRLVTMLLPIDAVTIARDFLPDNALGKLASRALGAVGGLVWREARHSPSGEYACRSIAHFDERFDDLWEKARGLRDIMIVRDSAYLHWRFSVPGRDQWALAVERDGRPVGYAVVRKRSDGVAEIKDLLTDPNEHATETLIHAVVARAREEGGIGVIFQGLEGSPYFESFRSCGFRFMPRASGSGLVLVPGTVTDMPPLWGQSSRWYLTSGDRE
jgi:GNAT superfamily N-acetyltransferase